MEPDPRVRTFADEGELDSAIRALWPADPELALDEYRLRKAEQSLLTEAGRILQTAFGFSEGEVQVEDIKPSPGKIARPRGEADRDRFTIYVDRTGGAGRFTGITIRGVKECRPNAAATVFASALFHALDDACTMARKAGGHKGLEMLTLALEESTAITFLKQFIEEPLNPFAEFMVGYVPFRGGFLRAKALGQWMRRIPGTTFEGALLKTGLVLDTSTESPRKRPLADGHHVAFFDQPIPIADVFGSKQDLVLADGQSSFLLVRTDMKVYGVVLVRTPIDIDYMQRGVSPDLDDAPGVDKLWIQSVDHRRLAIYGTMPDGSLVHIADIQNGALRLRDPRADFDIAVDAVMGVVEPRAREAVRPLMHALMERTLAGRGGVVVIGEKPRQIDIRRRIEPGLTLHDSGRSWQSLLNPDGVALLNAALEMVAVGGFIKSIAGARSGGAGTRHAASAKATLGKKNVAIAISDDRTLTVYKGGARLTRIG